MPAAASRSQHRVDLVTVRAHAGEVRHRLDADLVLDAPHQLDGLVARAAAGAVGDRHKRWPQLPQALDGLVQVLFPGFGLGGKELEGEHRAVGAKQIADVHAVA